MTQIQNLIIYGKKYIVSPQVEALLCNLLNINSFQLLNSKSNIVSQEIETKFKAGVKEIYNTKKSSSVIPYINFCDLHFKLSDDVLLSHFETQEVVMQTIEYIDKLFNGKGRVIDMIIQLFNQ